MMTLHIRTRDHKETRLELPTPPDELRRQTEAVFNAGETLCVSHIDSPIPGLQRHFRDMAFTNESTLRKLNRLAKMMDNMIQLTLSSDSNSGGRRASGRRNSASFAASARPSRRRRTSAFK